ncbi:MAG TPA: hypothetical protein V6C86_21175 [Oculatellaceae cyanobacterium]
MLKKIALAIAILALSTQSSIPSYSNESITPGDAPEYSRHLDRTIYQMDQANEK